MSHRPSAPRAAAALAAVWAAAATSLAAPAAAQEPGSPGPAPAEPVVVGLVIDGPWSENDDVVALFEREILELTRGEFDVRFPEEHRILGDWTLGSVSAGVDRLLADPEVDIVLPLGILSASYATQLEELPKPVVAPFIVDARLQGLPRRGDASGRHNLCYFSSPADIERDLRSFRRVAPFEHLTILLNRHVFESVPSVALRFDEVTSELGITYEALLVSDSLDEVLAALDPEAEAVYVAPLLQISPEEFQELVGALIEHKLPSYSLYGRAEVEAGLLCTSNPRLDFVRYARRTAITVQRILLGEDAGDLPVDIDLDGGLVINMATARAIDVWPSWSTLMDAELLNEEPTVVDRRWTLPSAMREARALNRDLVAAAASVEAGSQVVEEARSQLGPQLQASVAGAWIDEDRGATLFAPAERSLTGSLVLRQLVYSEAVWGNLDVEAHLQETRELDRSSLELDVVLDVALAYLDVLATKSLERIQKDNLSLTRSNLDLARTRREVGVASSSEVYRWESELAAGKGDVLGATARRRQAEVALNRLLHRPLSETIDTAESGITEPEIGLDPRLVEILDNPWGFGVFSDLMVEQGLEKSPELRSLEAGLAARSRASLAARRAFYVPNVGVEASLDQLLAEGGEGQDLRPVDDTDWSVAVFAALPIYAGGQRSATRERTRHELIQLRLVWEATRERVEQRIRNALLAISASRPALQLSREAAEAAHSNLELVQDAYAQGTVTIITLLDAQNAALVADQVAANAVYAFQADVMRAQRAVGGFSVFLTDAEREAWIQRVLAHFEDERTDPPRESSR